MHPLLLLLGAKQVEKGIDWIVQRYGRRKVLLVVVVWCAIVILLLELGWM